jgi:ankyrin repeat protein
MLDNLFFYFQYGTTPLIWACRKGHAEVVDMLLGDGAVVDKAGMVSEAWFAFSNYAFEH